MIDRFDQAMCAMQSAVFGHDIYGPDHPQVDDQVARAFELLAGMLTERSSLAFVALDDRVVFDDQRLPSGPSLNDGFVARLRDHDIEGVTFTKGLTEDELTRWLDCWNQDADQVPKHMNTAHIRTERIDDDGEGDFKVDPLRTAASSQEAAAMANRVLHGNDGGLPDLTLVCDLVEHLSANVTQAAGALLPLATLRQHDEYTSVHTINVAMMATALAEQVGLNSDQVHSIAVGAVLHDLGKREVAARILNKPGKLTDAEFNAIEQHPADGARALMQIKDMPPIAVVIAYEHHMHLDGTGYPHAHDRRPHLSSQIVQLADVYDALRTHRPYRQALSLAKATEILRSGAGTKYDAALLDLFFDRVAVNAQHHDAQAA